MRRRASTTGEIILRVYLFKFHLYMPNKISRTTRVSVRNCTARALLEAETFFSLETRRPVRPPAHARAPFLPSPR